MLDDELVRFIDGLLADQPVTSVLTTLAERYPEVTAQNLEAAVAEMRRRLSEQIEREGTARLQETDAQT